MLTIQRTTDLHLVRQIMTHPKLFKHLNQSDPASFRPNPDPSVYYMIVFDSASILGLFITQPVFTEACWEVHHAILPEHLSRTDDIGAMFEDWLWSNTPCNTALGFTPSCNRLALKYAERHGMRRAGQIAKSYLKDGQLYDLVIFQKQRPELF